MNPHLLHDGVASGEGSAGSRALHYGDGVFRTMLWTDGRVLDWALHMDKLAADCAALELEPPATALLGDEVARVVAGEKDAVVKVIVARRSGERGYRPATRASERWVSAYPLPAAIPDASHRGVRLAFSGVLLSEQPLLAGVKHLNRLDQVLASRSWPDGIDELLMRDRHGHVVCGTRTNLFCVVGDRLITPALDRCGVAGIMRRRILECAAGLGMNASVTALTETELLRADEVLVCNSLIGLWPVRGLGTRAWQAPGPRTQALLCSLRHPRTSFE